MIFRSQFSHKSCKNQYKWNIQTFLVTDHKLSFSNIKKEEWSVNFKKILKQTGLPQGLAHTSHSTN